MLAGRKVSARQKLIFIEGSDDKTNIHEEEVPTGQYLELYLEHMVDTSCYHIRQGVKVLCKLVLISVNEQ